MIHVRYIENNARQTNVFKYMRLGREGIDHEFTLMCLTLSDISCRTTYLMQEHTSLLLHVNWLKIKSKYYFFNHVGKRMFDFLK